MLLYHDDKGSHKQATGTTCHSVAIAPSKFVCLTMCYLPSKCVPKILIIFSHLPFFSFFFSGTDMCEAGQGCFWFSQGCTIGCKKCDGNGERVPGGRNVCNSTM